MTAPLSGPQLHEAIRQLARDLKLLEGAIQRINVVVAPLALWSIREAKRRLDEIRPRYSACLSGITRHAASAEDVAATGLAGRSLISLINLRDRWGRVESSLDRVTAQALGSLAVWLGVVSLLLAILILFRG